MRARGTSTCTFRRIRPRVAARLEGEHTDSSAEIRADAVLVAVERHKGRFAQALLRELREGQELQLPPYLREAIEWLTERPHEVEEPTADGPGSQPEGEAESGGDGSTAAPS